MRLRRRRVTEHVDTRLRRRLSLSLHRRRERRWLSLRHALLSSLLCLMLAGAALAAPPEDTSGPAAPLTHFLSGLKTLAADFKQNVYDETGALLETSEGRLRMARPGRFAWVYNAPYRQTIISDGTQLWLYDEDLAQVTVSTVTETLAGSAAQLLGDDVDPSAQYQISSLPARENLTWIALDPRADSAQYTHLELAFAGEALARMRLTDNLGQVTELLFENLSRNPVLPADSFDFRVPAGVDVVNATAP